MNTISKKNVFLVFIPFLLLIGCKDEFTPFVKSEMEIMVYSIIDNRLPYQKAYVQKSYTNADNKKNVGSLNIALTRLGLLSKTNFTIGSIENQDYLIYTLPNYDLLRGYFYVLDIDTGQVWTSNPANKYVSASIYLPALSLNSATMGCIDNVKQTTYYLNVSFNEISGSFYSVYSSYIDYEINLNGKSVAKTIEIPLSIEINKEYYSPELTIGQYAPEALTLKYPIIKYLYKTRSDYQSNGLEYSFEKMKIDANKDSVTIKRIYVYNYMIDNNLYEKFMKEGLEVSSSRFDEPYYFSNLIKRYSNERGIGFFGFVLKDSCEIPNNKDVSDLIRKLGFKNGIK